MKKLLITSMAAVAVSICAKADFTANESFEFKKNAQGENVPLTEEGPFFDVDENGKYIYGLNWMSEATPEDGIFTVTNITKITSEEAPYPTDRPLSGNNANALAIDTEKSLIRRVIPSADSTVLEGASLEGEGAGPIFFDSVVQFTATETAPETTGAKLVAWLYKTEELAEGEKGLFGETDPISKLVVTALYDDGKDLFKTNYLTDVTIQPETWHRLTIKSFVQDDLLQFEVRVDGNIVKVNEEQVPFISLDELGGTADKTLKGVAFEGKGAVDDLVFTTEDPFAGGGGEDPEPEPEADKFTLKFTINAAEEAGAAVLLVVADGAEKEANDEDNFILGVDVKSVVAKILCSSGYKVTGATESTEESTEDESVWLLPVDVTSAAAGGEITCNVEVVADSGDEPGTETPTVDPTSGTLSAVVPGDAKADPDDIAAQVTISISAADTAAGVTALYFKRTAVYDPAKSQWVVTVALDETVVQPSADEALENVAAALTGDGTTVSITYKGDTIKPGLYYGLAAAGDLTALETAVPANFARATTDGVALSADKPEGNAGFFKVVISATNPVQE